MKKYFIALLFGMSLMSMQTASAATLSLAQVFGTGSVTTASGSEVEGTGTGGTLWEVTLSGLGLGGTADLDLDSHVSGPITFFSSGFIGTNGIGVSDGIYQLAIFLLPSTSTFTFTVELDNVQPGIATPIPAAIWLFGSALLGLIGVSGRKSKSALAA